MGVNVNPNSRQSGGQSLSIIWIIAGALGIIFGGLLIGTLAPLVLPVQASAESQQVDSLFRFMLVIGGAIFLLVIGALVYSIIAYRAKPGDRSDGPPIHGNSTLEIVWTLIPAVIVIILTIHSFPGLDQHPHRARGQPGRRRGRTALRMVVQLRHHPGDPAAGCLDRHARRASSHGAHLRGRAAFQQSAASHLGWPAGRGQDQI
ncbi:MAG: hypothetical protein IPK19_41930 [Chloroflexi bacterium]|nr:hypothetical protein [Chloroflexota bacterium]